jgi:putative ATP-dependent endonuclease of the OLD family
LRIARLRVSNFRCIETGEFFPTKHNVLLGPNNTGKTAVLEAINLLLNPEGPWQIDENDFYRRNYSGLDQSPPTEPHTVAAPGTIAAAPQEAVPPIQIEAVLTDLTPEEEEIFKANLVPWDFRTNSVIERADELGDPFANASPSIRVVFEGWYDKDEDAFASKTFFLRSPEIDKESCDELTRRHKRQIGFLIYRDFRALTRPITLEPRTLFTRLLESQEVLPRRFEQVLNRIQGTLDPIVSDPEFSSILQAYKSEIERFLPLSASASSAIGFEFTDRTRASLKEETQLYVQDELFLPLQKMGAGTRSLAILSMLTLLMRRRQRGILALEEPETFLFPHAQRRVADECRNLADQTFVTTHSPYVLERMPLEGVTRISRDSQGKLTFHPISPTTVQEVNLYFRRLRQTFSEALLGRGVLVVEGDSDRWWINGASRIMNRAVYQSRRQEALELLGIAVVSADSNSDIPKLGRFFVDAGLRTVGLADRTDDPTIASSYCAAPFPVILLRHKGLEHLLSDTLPLDLVRVILTQAPESRTPVLDPARVAALAEAELRGRFYDCLVANKGTAALHEWILGQLTAHTLPNQLKVVLDRVAAFVEGADHFATHSLPV